MSKIRSILALALAFVMAMFITVSSPAMAKAKAKPRTYSAEQIATIQEFSGEVNAMRDRLTELEGLIEKEDWIFMRNFVHGPFGELRSKLLFISQQLFPETRQEAQAAIKDVAAALVTIDKAGIDKDYRLAARGYSSLVKSLDSFFSLLPSA
ncbi:MAG: photosystem II protein PsbQ [Synechococcales bacterium]|nr:photosystem II protein PsbQ [Synechococcales bacterium]